MHLHLTWCTRFFVCRKVTSAPKLSPHSLLIIPIFPMDIVMTGVSDSLP